MKILLKKLNCYQLLYAQYTAVMIMFIEVKYFFLNRCKNYVKINLTRNNYE